MDPEPCSRRKSSFLAACSHLRPRCRDGSAEWSQRVRGCRLFWWFLARRRRLTSQTPLILRSAGAHDVLSWLWKPPVPKVPLRNPTIVSFRENSWRTYFFLLVILHWKKMMWCCFKTPNLLLHTLPCNWWPQWGDHTEWLCHRNWIRANWWYYSLGCAVLATNHSATEQ